MAKLDRILEILTLKLLIADRFMIDTNLILKDSGGAATSTIEDSLELWLFPMRTFSEILMRFLIFVVLKKGSSHPCTI